jgi:hypothetical protein
MLPCVRFHISKLGNRASSVVASLACNIPMLLFDFGSVRSLANITTFSLAMGFQEAIENHKIRTILFLPTYLDSLVLVLGWKV